LHEFPSDNNFDARDSNIPGQLSFTATLLSPSFHVLNSVVNGINPIPNQFTGGEGPVTGEEVQINVTFITPFVLGPDHVFFRPEVGVSNVDFLWLSAPRPIIPPGTPFADDLQTWIRNDGTQEPWRQTGSASVRTSPRRVHSTRPSRSSAQRTRTQLVDSPRKYPNGIRLGPALPEIALALLAFG
jgi:hypothetical protein